MQRYYSNSRYLHQKTPSYYWVKEATVALETAQSLAGGEWAKKQALAYRQPLVTKHGNILALEDVMSVLRVRPVATGAIFNPRSGSCLQIGGALDQQCYGLVKQAGERSVIAPSPFPAYVYPCDRGCDPEGMQRWVFEPASPPPPSSASPQQQTYRIRLRKNRRFCLRQGIDELRTSRW